MFDAYYLIEKLDLNIPLIGVYDIEEWQDFNPIVEPHAHKRSCMFEFYNDWLEGKTLVLSDINYGCGSCGKWWFGKETRSREDYVDFLANKEGLKATEALMGQWLDKMKPYEPENSLILVGPLKEHNYEFLKTISFFINPDQLSVLIAGAQYFHRPGDPAPILSEFGSGCMEMLPLLASYKEPKAMIGATDMAMRDSLPPDILTFTVNKSMFELLCKLDESSFLGKPFLKNLRKSRGGTIGT